MRDFYFDPFGSPIDIVVCRLQLKCKFSRLFLWVDALTLLWALSHTRVSRSTFHLLDRLTSVALQHVRLKTFSGASRCDQQQQRVSEREDGKRNGKIYIKFRKWIIKIVACSISCFLISVSERNSIIVIWFRKTDKVVLFDSEAERERGTCDRWLNAWSQLSPRLECGPIEQQNVRNSHESRMSVLLWSCKKQKSPQKLTQPDIWHLIFNWISHNMTNTAAAALRTGQGLRYEPIMRVRCCTIVDLLYKLSS